MSTTNVTTTVTRNRKIKRKPKSSNKTKKVMFNNQSAPISKSIRMVKKPATIKSTTGTTICVAHTEFIADIISTGSAFAVTRYAVNPGLNVSFPWLSNMANNYESYKFKKLEYQYKPICATSTPGKVILAIDFDAADAAPSSKLVMNSYEGAVSCSPWDLITYKATNANLNKFGVQRFVRVGIVPTGTDIKTYDIGNILVGTSNTPATSTTLGELYVTYEVEFYTPQLPASISLTPGTGETNTFGLQNGVVSISSTGIASLTASYYNRLMYYIVQQVVIPGNKMLMDIAVNPFINKPIRWDLSAPLNTIIGCPADISDGLFGLDYITNIVNIFAPSSNQYYNRSWVSRPTRSYQQDHNTPRLSVYRFEIPWVATGNSILRLVCQTLEGYPNDVGTNMYALGDSFSSPLISNVNFDWNKPGSVANNMLLNAATNDIADLLATFETL